MSTITDLSLEYILGGENLRIYTYPSPVLKKVASNVETFDDQLKKLVRDMLCTMYNAPGIGLAAPQVGVSQRIFVIDIDFDLDEEEEDLEKSLTNTNPLVFINPVIRDKEGEILYEEGCLSVPGIYEEVKRYETATVDYFDIDGNEKSMNLSGLLSICVQHENDHLDGVVFLEKLSLIKRNLVTKKYLKKKKNG